MTQNEHRQKDSHARSASSVSCRQWWPAEDVWGWGYGHSKHAAILCQNNPLVFKKLLLRDTLSQTHYLSSLVFNVLLLREFIRSPSLHTVSTPPASFGKEFQRFNSLLCDEIFAFSFVCFLWTFYQLPCLEDPGFYTGRESGREFSMCIPHNFTGFCYIPLSVATHFAWKAAPYLVLPYLVSPEICVLPLTTFVTVH